MLMRQAHGRWEEQPSNEQDENAESDLGGDQHMHQARAGVRLPAF